MLRLLLLIVPVAGQIPSATSPAEEVFDCYAGANNWLMGWSQAKKEQCCRRGGRPNNAPGFAQWCIDRGSGGSNPFPSPAPPITADNKAECEGTYDYDAGIDYWKNQMVASEGKCDVDVNGKLNCAWRNYCEGGSTLQQNGETTTQKAVVYDCGTDECRASILHGPCCRTCEEQQNRGGGSIIVDGQQVDHVVCRGCDDVRRLQWGQSGKHELSSNENPSICTEQGSGFRCEAQKKCSTGVIEQASKIKEGFKCFTWPCYKCKRGTYAFADCCHTCFKKAKDSNQKLACVWCHIPMWPWVLTLLVGMLLFCCLCCLCICCFKILCPNKKLKDIAPMVAPEKTWYESVKERNCSG